MAEPREHILDELAWRGLLAQHTDLDALRRDLDAGPVTLYAGFDPTAASLHAGHLVQVLTLVRLQRAGHRPVVLAGGATGQIGDPREVGERVMQSREQVAEQTERIAAQLARFLEFDDSPTGAVAENNLSWTGSLSTVDFLRDVGKHFSVNVMLARDTVKRRLEGDGMSFTEFSYVLLQAHDYLQLHRRLGCALQIGGSDQWGNVVAGVDLVRRVEGATVHALTTPLVTAADGTKLGKSTGGGSVWLDPELTSPYAWYQYFVNTADADVERYLRWFTFLGADEIAAIAAETAERPQLRTGQKRLAAELTTLVHGEAQTRGAELASQALFGRGELRDLDEPTLVAALAEAGTTEVAAADRPTVVELLVASGLCASRGAARRAVGEGGVSVNNAKVAQESWSPAPEDLLHGAWLVLRRGRRHTAGIRVRRD
ncbi:tyrosine--tRNA ligase [Rhodococcus aerolatus]